MADNDLDLDLGTDTTRDDNPSIIRIKELSNKVKLTSKERDELKELNTKTTQERDTAIKERDFYASFSKTAGKYPSASEHLDEIKAKVMAGYDPEDATVSVLAKAGKLTSPKVDKTEAAGGSASTTVTGTKKKEIGEMSQAEKLEALKESLVWE